MNPQVVTVSAHQTMTEAAEVFTRRRISGAPVVDEHGHCLGILSATDFVRRESESRAAERAVLAGAEHELVRRRESHGYSIECMGDDLVRNHMTSAVQTIPATATLIQAARIMCTDHIHRLPVLDSDAHPVGFLSSLDLVAAMLKAVEE
jgi:CBS domain-containing membrane protein